MNHRNTSHDHVPGACVHRQPAGVLQVGPGQTHKRDATRELLLATARTEFLRYGFQGTDVTRIARRAGVSPNTFYRFFKDQFDVFVSVYVDWAAGERRAFARLMAQAAPAAEILNEWIERHRRNRCFRRSARRLGYEDALVRRAVAQARLDMLAGLKAWMGGSCADDAGLAVDLLQIEQLAESLAEAELADMGLDDSTARERMAAIFMRWRIRPAPPVDVTFDEGAAVSA
ncbi:MAG TPA: TetR/AcrR family transcriptional regulator [Caulobacteraceae bacterium]|nr:TetR/AcrR family transcriptional regulator [Caulobacteraceae bacterium]